MSFSAFLLLLAVGAALLAAWLLPLLPDDAPSRLRHAVIHFAVSLVLVWVTPSVVAVFASGNESVAVLGAFLLVLPALVYACLSAAWVLRFVYEELQT